MEALHPALYAPVGMDNYLQAERPTIAIPQLCYGLGLKDDELAQFAVEKLLILKALHAHYTKVTGRRHMNEVECKHEEFESVIALYDNYWLASHPNTISERKQKSILKKMRRAFDLPDDRQPMWYFEKSWYDTIIKGRVSIIIFTFDLSSKSIHASISSVNPFHSHHRDVTSVSSIVYGVRSLLSTLHVLLTYVVYYTESNNSVQ